jgi:hypothetical protein
MFVDDDHHDEDKDDKGDEHPHNGAKIDSDADPASARDDDSFVGGVEIYPPKKPSFIWVFI